MESIELRQDMSGVYLISGDLSLGMLKVILYNILYCHSSENNCCSLSSVVQNHPQFTSQILFANLVSYDNCYGKHYSPPDTFRAVATCSYGDQNLVVAFQPYGSPSFQA